MRSSRRRNRRPGGVTRRVLNLERDLLAERVRSRRFEVEQDTRWGGEHNVFVGRDVRAVGACELLVDERDKAVLVGHDLGGFVCRRRPDRRRFRHQIFGGCASVDCVRVFDHVPVGQVVCHPCRQDHRPAGTVLVVFVKRARPVFAGRRERDGTPQLGRDGARTGCDSPVKDFVVDAVRQVDGFDVDVAAIRRRAVVLEPLNADIQLHRVGVTLRGSTYATLREEAANLVVGTLIRRVAVIHPPRR